MATTEAALTDGARLTALLDSHFLQAGHLPGLDRIVDLACRLLRVEVCCISAIGAQTQIQKNYRGLASGGGVPVRDSICQHVVARDDAVVIDDTGRHLLTRYNSAWQKNRIRAYLGLPLRHAGQVVGTICAVAAAPRVWTETDIEILGDLAHCAMLEIRLGRAGASLFDPAGR